MALRSTPLHWQSSAFVSSWAMGLDPAAPTLTQRLKVSPSSIPMAYTTSISITANATMLDLPGSHRQQLLRRCWFPATHIEPQSRGTFAVLAQLHMLNLRGKIAGYDYYSGLQKLTDNTGLSKIKVSLHCSSSCDAC